jgi:hypothetical protein
MKSNFMRDSQNKLMCHFKGTNLSKVLKCKDYLNINLYTKLKTNNLELAELIIYTVSTRV